MDEGKSEIF
jgi:WD40 repeat protein